MWLVDCFELYSFVNTTWIQSPKNMQQKSRKYIKYYAYSERSKFSTMFFYQLR